MAKIELKTTEDLVKAGFEGRVLTERKSRDDELRRLAELASSVTDGIILEIGTMYGASACVMAANTNVPVYCVDLWDLTYIGDFRLSHKFYMERWEKTHSLLATFRGNIKRLGVESKITYINALSKEVAKIWDKPIGMLFIDGDHSYEGCRGDYDGFAKHIKPGGILAFHDYKNKKAHDGIARCVEEIREDWLDWQQVGVLVHARRR